MFTPNSWLAHILFCIHVAFLPNFLVDMQTRVAGFYRDFKFWLNVRHWNTTQHSVAWFYNICLIKLYNLKLYPVWRMCLHGMRVRSVACFLFVRKGYLHTNIMYEKIWTTIETALLHLVRFGFYKLSTLTLLSEFIAFSFSTLTDILNLQRTTYFMVAWHFSSSWWSSRPLSMV
jgi:hypothetical protein